MFKFISESQTYLRKRVFIQAIKLAVLISESELLFYTIYIRGVLLAHIRIIYVAWNSFVITACCYVRLLRFCMVQPDLVKE